jgi:hypothetical protein
VQSRRGFPNVFGTLILVEVWRIREFVIFLGSEVVLSGPYRIVEICSDEPDPRDEQLEEWCVEFSREIKPRLYRGFCTMWKRGGKIVLEIAGGTEDLPMHDLDELMTALQNGASLLHNLYPDDEQS